MRVMEWYSHLNGLEYLSYHRRYLLDEIWEVIANVNAERCRTKQSEEVKKAGRLLFSPKDMNIEFERNFNALGWREHRVNNWLSENVEVTKSTANMSAFEQKALIEGAGGNPIKTYNQIDFVKDRAAVEVQFGKYAFVAHDLFVKHMSFYSNGEIDVGVEIVPMKSMEREMSSGVPYYERDLFNLMRQSRGTPAVPLILIGVAP